MSEDPRETIRHIDYLTERGWGVVSPDGYWWNRNIAKSDPGQMVLATESCPIFGMVNKHKVHDD